MIDTYREHGYDIFELPAGAKFPPPTGWQRLASNSREIPPGWNFGVSTERFIIIDFDDVDLAREFYRTRRDIITTLVKTPSGGIHSYHSGQSNNSQNGTWDVRGIGGYGVGAGSVVDGKKYEFVPGHPLVPLGELKPAPEEYLKRKEVTSREIEPDGVMRVRRAEEYGKQIFATSGSGGHNTTFRYACFMRDIGLTEGEAYLVLERWNETNADPKWSVKELGHKVRSAFNQKGAKSA